MFFAKFCLMLHLQEQIGCDSTTGDEFLFMEEKVGKLFIYKYLASNTPMCLAVGDNCDDNLSLIKSTHFRERRCKFLRLTRRSR